MIRKYQGYIPPEPIAPPVPDTGVVLLIMVDADSNIPIEGATIQLQCQHGVSWEDYLTGAGMTDAGGKLQFSDLPVGTYRFSQTAAAEGYNPDSTAFTPETFSIMEGAGTQSSTIQSTSIKLQQPVPNPQDSPADQLLESPVSTAVDLDALYEQLMSKEFDLVAAYAAEYSIDIGRVTTVKSAVDKIIAALKQQGGDSDDGTGA